MANEIDPKVEHFKEAIKEQRWNDISSEVWGDVKNQQALSQAARSGNTPVEFKKNDQGELVMEFTRPGVTGWIKDHMSEKPQVLIK